MKQFLLLLIICALQPLAHGESKDEEFKRRLDLCLQKISDACVHDIEAYVKGAKFEAERPYFIKFVGEELLFGTSVSQVQVPAGQDPKVAAFFTRVDSECNITIGPVPQM